MEEQIFNAEKSELKTKYLEETIVVEKSKPFEKKYKEENLQDIPPLENVDEEMNEKIERGEEEEEEEEEKDVKFELQTVDMFSAEGEGEGKEEGAEEEIKTVNLSEKGAKPTSWKGYSWWKYYSQILKEKTGVCQASRDEVLEAKLKEIETMKQEYCEMVKSSQHLVESFQSLTKSLKGVEKCFGRFLLRENLEDENGKKNEDNVGKEADLKVKSSVENEPQKEGENAELKQCEEEENKEEKEFQPLLQSNVFLLERSGKRGQFFTLVFQHFVENLKTLCEKTIQDTLETASNLEVTRISYDYDKDMLEKTQNAISAPEGDLEAKQKVYEKSRKLFESKKNDLEVKLELLHENRRNLIQKQLVLMQSALQVFLGEDEKKNTDVFEESVKDFVNFV